MNLNIIIIGLSVTSSWGNGHATTYRALVRGLVARGHEVLFLERDVPWYAAERDLPAPPYGRTALYASVDDLTTRWHDEVRDADCVIVGSYVPDGIAIGQWVLDLARGVTAFYDIDTPVTLAALDAGGTSYLSPWQIGRYDLYLSFTGGPVLGRLERVFGARRARALFCSVDANLYRPADTAARWDLGYMGTYSADRQAGLEALLLAPAQQRPERQFAVAGSSYPEDVSWPVNVARFEHLPPADHRAFYTSQRYSLNLTRAEMTLAGHSPSVRLFEAAACGTPVISDSWPGLDLLFRPGVEILVASSTADVLRYLQDIDEPARRSIGGRARARVLQAHTPAHRARELERYIDEAAGARAGRVAS